MMMTRTMTRTQTRAAGPTVDHRPGGPALGSTMYTTVLGGATRGGRSWTTAAPLAGLFPSHGDGAGSASAGGQKAAMPRSLSGLLCGVLVAVAATMWCPEAVRGFTLDLDITGDLPRTCDIVRFHTFDFLGDHPWQVELLVNVSASVFTLDEGMSGVRLHVCIGNEPVDLSDWEKTKKQQQQQHQQGSGGSEKLSHVDDQTHGWITRMQTPVCFRGDRLWTTAHTTQRLMFPAVNSTSPDTIRIPHYLQFFGTARGRGYSLDRSTASVVPMSRVPVSRTQDLFRQLRLSRQQQHNNPERRCEAVTEVVRVWNMIPFSYSDAHLLDPQYAVCRPRRPPALRHVTPGSVLSDSLHSIMRGPLPMKPARETRSEYQACYCNATTRGYMKFVRKDESCAKDTNSTYADEPKPLTVLLWVDTRTTGRYAVLFRDWMFELMLSRVRHETTSVEVTSFSKVMQRIFLNESDAVPLPVNDRPVLFVLCMHGDPRINVTSWLDSRWLMNTSKNWMLFHTNHEQPWTTNTSDYLNYQPVQPLVDSYSAWGATFRTSYWRNLSDSTIYTPMGPSGFHRWRNAVSMFWLERPASQRDHRCYFRGRETAGRIALRNYLTNEGVSCFIQFDTPSRAVMGQEMAQAVFTLCPSGTTFETFRIWEALETGALPVIQRPRPEADFTENDVWEGYPEELLLDQWDEFPPLYHKYDAPTLIDGLQQNVQSWYARFKVRFAESVASTMRHVRDGFDPSRAVLVPY